MGTESTGLPIKPLLRPDEVAKHLDVSVRTIYNWLEDGTLNGIKIKGIVRIHYKDVIALISTDGAGYTMRIL